MNRWQKWMICAGALLSAAGAQALQVEGHVYDDTARVAEQPLRLNGAGVRSQLWFKAFTAGLYLPEPATQASSVLAQGGSKRLRLRMLVDVPSKEFAKALQRGVEKNHSEAERTPMAERLSRLAHTVQGLGTLHNGDTVDLDFLPGLGLVLSLNGRQRGEPVPGDDVYRALLRIFIGERPAQPALKDSLLRGRPN